MNKHDLLHKIKSLENLSQDERAYLINLVNTKKKYGLVWEDKPEDVEELLRENLPVLREVKERRILGKPLPVTEAAKNNPQLFEKEPKQKNKEAEEYPNHILIEGDNLHALTALTFTHEGKVDVIYIDPPYNTGNKDFKYNDSFVDKEDSYRHSKWLSFMDKRLRIAKRLLSEKGFIFISIDDNEQAQLKLLCNEILGEENFVSEMIWQKAAGSQNDAKHVSISHEYIMVYAKQITNVKLNQLPLSNETANAYKFEDEFVKTRGKYQLRNLNDPSIGDRPGLHYNITCPDGTILIGKDNQWRCDEKHFNWRKENGRIVFKKDKDKKTNVYYKLYLNEVNEELIIGEDGNSITKGVNPNSLLVNLVFNGQGGNDIKDIFHNKIFSYPKPIEFIKHLIKISSKGEYKILDFFAGSGTTLHAVMQLNAEDGGNRQCILITNNENNICEEVTYERNKRVIQGYTNAKGEQVPGLTNNTLRYYKSEFVSRDTSIKNKRELTRLATELLCIKEDMYEEQKTIGDYQLNATYVRGFHQGNHYMLIIYDDEVIEQVVKVIEQTVKKSKGAKLHFKIYVFSNGQYPYTEEFEEVLPHVTLCALPDAIYKAYQNVLPKKHRAAIPQIEEEAITEE